MDSNKVAAWIQITATVGVLVGIILVVIELRQAKAIAHANITANFFSESAQNSRSLMGENPAIVLAKACVKPDEVMTQEELFVLEAYFGTQWALADRSHRLELVGDFDTPWQEVSKKTLQSVALLKQGRIWLKQRAAVLNPSLSDVVVELLNETKNTRCGGSL
jgi:hypothetical protein